MAQNSKLLGSSTWASVVLGLYQMADVDWPSPAHVAE
jgi:hypothetical protein